jgi:hypothetical protein
MAHHKHPDPHGNAPDKSALALVLIDVINDFELDESAPRLFARLIDGDRFH